MNSCKTYDEASKRKLYKKFLKGYIIFLLIFVLLFLFATGFAKSDVLGLLGLIGPYILIRIQIEFGKLSVKHNWKKSTDIVVNVIMLFIFFKVTIFSIVFVTFMVFSTIDPFWFF